VTRGDLEIPVTGSGRKASVHDLWVDMSSLTNGARRRFRASDASANPEAGFFVAAPRVTDSLAFTIKSIPQGLSLLSDPTLDSPYPTRTGFRAGAISACFLLVHAAATELDVAPEEFEVLEPSLWGTTKKPLLQICDYHMNGAGFCQRLNAARGREPLAIELMRRVVAVAHGTPLEGQMTDHALACDQACYRCLCRFGNQPYHGLLDWRLGLDVLNLFLDSKFSAGLRADDYSTPGLRDWPRLVEHYSTEVCRLLP
jgi:DEAD/DEAH box helicase domain-containing protein